MGAHPKRKTAKARKNERRSHIKTGATPAVMECSECHSMKAPHQVCPTCGTYNGREVIALKEPKAKSEH